MRHNGRCNETPAAKRKPAPPARAAKKPTSAGSRPKLTNVEKSLGLGDGLYGKQSLEEGATQQFEQRYGKPEKTQGMQILEAQRASQNLGRGKRKKTVPAKLR